MTLKPFALAVFLAGPALAGTLKLVGELPDLKLANPRKLSERHLLVGVAWSPTAPGRPRYQLLDLEKRERLEVEVPLAAFPATQAALLSAKQPNIELQHYSDGVVTFTTTARKGAETVATYLGQFDAHTSQFRELVFVGPWGPRQVVQPLGVDPTGVFFYAARATLGPGTVGLQGYTTLELVRVNLHTLTLDWEGALDVPKRERPLQFVGNRAFFSADGQRLALVEYSEQSLRSQYPRDEEPQVWVIDAASKRIDRYRAPLTAYGVAFSGDKRYLALGSSQRGDLWRINLEERRVDLEVKGHRMVEQFVSTPSGNGFLVLSNTLLSAPKVVEVRRFADLSVQAAIPVRLFFPGSDDVYVESYAGLDGRMLVLPLVDAKGWPQNQGVRLFAVPPDVDAPTVEGGAGGSLAKAEAVALGKQYAHEQHLLYSQTREDPAATFSTAVATSGGEVCVAAVQSGNSDGDYKPGRTQAVVARLDQKGQPRWRRTLTKAGFLDFEGGLAAPAPDGGCYFSFAAYVHPGRHPNTWLFKVNSAGHTVWSYLSKGNGGAKTQLGDQLALRSDGSIEITGRWYEDAEDKVRHSWRALISPAGALLSDEISPVGGGETRH